MTLYSTTLLRVIMYPIRRELQVNGMYNWAGLGWCHQQAAVCRARHWASPGHDSTPAGPSPRQPNPRRLCRWLLPSLRRSRLGSPAARPLLCSLPTDKGQTLASERASGGRQPRRISKSIRFESPAIKEEGSLGVPDFRLLLLASPSQANEIPLLVSLYPR